MIKEWWQSMKPMRPRDMFLNCTCMFVFGFVLALILCAHEPIVSRIVYVSGR
jgi:hypothetical protein